MYMPDAARTDGPGLIILCLSSHTKFWMLVGVALRYATMDPVDRFRVVTGSHCDALPSTTLLLAFNVLKAFEPIYNHYQ